MTDPDLQTALLEDPQPLLGGTMWLMSRFQTAPCPVLARRIVDNLGTLSTHPYCGEGLRRMCATMRAQWAAHCIRTQLDMASRSNAGRGDAEAVGVAPIGDETDGDRAGRNLSRRAEDTDATSGPATPCRRLH
jgi:hypothetical protein